LRRVLFFSLGTKLPTLLPLSFFSFFLAGPTTAYRKEGKAFLSHLVDRSFPCPKFHSLRFLVNVSITIRIYAADHKDFTPNSPPPPPLLMSSLFRLLFRMSFCEGMILCCFVHLVLSHYLLPPPWVFSSVLCIPFLSEVFLVPPRFGFFPQPPLWFFPFFVILGTLDPFLPFLPV